MKKVLKVLGILFAAILLAAFGIYLFVLQYPNLKENPTVGKWYRVTTGEMKTSEGSSYRAFFKKGSENIWQTPEEISDKLTGNNLTLDCLSALHEKYGDGIHLLFDNSTRDGDLAKCQNYFDTGVMDVTGTKEPPNRS